MPTPNHTTLPTPVLDALGRGETIEAIKLLRTASGLGLKEAKDMIDAHAAGQPMPSFDPTMPAGALSANVIEALRRGHKIEAVRLVRDQTGMGLKEAKDAVDEYERTHAAPIDISPGQVRGGGAMRWLVALGVAGLLGYYLLRGMGSA